MKNSTNRVAKFLALTVSTLLMITSLNVKAQTPAGALNFDGSNDYVQVPRSISGDFSISYWMKTTDVGGNGPNWYWGKGIVDAEVGGITQDFGTSLVVNKLAFGTGNPDITIFSTSNVNTGNWVYVTATRNRAIGEMKLYINGVLEASTSGATAAFLTVPGNIKFGGMQTLTNMFNGTLDEVSLWDRVLTPTEITAIMQNGGPSYPQANLVGYYRFNHGFVNANNAGLDALSDLSGSNNHGSLANMTLDGSASNWVEGVYPAAGALAFDGTNDYVRIGNPYNSFGNQLTVDWTADIDPTSPLGSGIGQSTENVDGPTAMQWIMHYLPGATPLMQFYVSDNGVWKHADAVVTAGWHRYTGVAGPTGIKIYKDGVLAATSPDVVTSNILTATNSVITLGKDSRWLNQRYMKGKIDEVRIWNRALCEGEIDQNAGCELNFPQNGLVEYYKLNSGYAGANNAGVTTATDESGNGRNGTLLNFALTGSTSNWLTGTTSGTCATFTPLTVSATSNSPVNGGSSINLTATASGTNAGSATYAWTGPNSFTSTSATPSVANAGTVHGGTYNITATANGCTASASTAVTVNPPAGALKFDGIDDYVNINNTLGNFGTGDFTVETWFRTTQTSVLYLISKRSICGPSTFWNLMIENGKLGMEMMSNGNHTPLNGTTIVNNGQWHHVAVTRQGSQMFMYLDGAVQAGGSFTVHNFTSSDPLQFARNVCNNQNSSFIYNGEMDEVRIWNRALCQTEINNNRNCALSGTQAGLQAYYKFNQGFAGANNSGITSLTDETGNNNGTLVNFGLTGSTSNWVVGNVSGTCAAFTPFSVSASSNSPVTAGSSISLTATPTGAGPGTLYLWTGPNSYSASGSTVTVNNAQPVNAGIYNVKAINAACTATAATTVVVNQPAGALDFDGVDDYVRIANPYNSFGNELTVEWSAQIDASSGMGSGISQSTEGNSNANATQWLMHYVPGYHVVQFYVSDNGVLKNVEAPVTSGWHRYTGVAGPTGIKIYKDGVLVQTSAQVVTGNITSSANSVITLGKDSRFLNQRYMKGQIDEVRIWNRALCEPEIQNNLNCELNMPQNGLVEYYKLNHGFVGVNNAGITTAADGSGNSRDGSLQGFALSGATSNWVAGSASAACNAFAVPEMSMTGNGNAIADGSATTSAANNTDFGSVPVGAGTTKGFMINNTGTAVLNFTGTPTVVISGPDAALFSVTSSLGASAIAGGSAAFNITFSPSAATGVKTATVSIGNDDCDENPYTFAISGTATCPAFTMYTLIGGGTICAGGFFNNHFFNGSQVGYSYQLKNNGVNVGPPIAGTGSSFLFGAVTVGGTYTVEAKHVASGCTQAMNGSSVVIVNPLPTVFNVTGGGAYCTGGSGSVIGLSGSQTGVSYQLKNGASNVGAAVPGTGAAFTFGTFTAAGTYTVVATALNCSSTMSGNAVISIDPLPTTFTVTGGGAYCTGGTGVAVGLSGSQTGVAYQLKNGAANAGSPVPGTGSAINFGLHTNVGNYTVVATNSSTNCTSNMNGTVGIATNPLPLATISGSTVCPGSIITANNTNGTGLSKIIWLKDGIAVDSSTTSGTPGTAVVVAGGNGGGAGSNQLSGPHKIFTSVNDTLYIADEVNQRVQKWAPGAASGVTVAGGNGAGSGANQFSNPRDVHVDAARNVYVLDGNNARVQKWAPGATTGVTVAGGNGPGGAANQFNDPYGMFVDAAGNIYVADRANHRIQKWIPSATSGTTVAGGNAQGSGLNQLSNPLEPFVDGAGNIYVADHSNTRVLKFAPGNPNGVVVAGGNGSGPGLNQLSAPWSVTVDANNNVYVSEQGNHRVTKWTPGATAGVIMAGGNGAGSAMNQLSGPQGVTMGTSGLYISDRNNNRILRLGIGSSNYTANTPGIYTAVVTSTAGCTNAATGSVTINAAPVVFNVTGGGSYCSGGTGVAIGLSGSQTGINYQLKNGAANIGAAVPGTGAALNFGSFTGVGSYTVVATNASTLCVVNMSGNAVVSVNPVPTITATSNSPVNLGNTLALAATGAATYSWTGPDNYIATGGNPVISNVQAVNDGTYTVIGTNAQGCKDTAITSVIISTTPAGALNFDGLNDRVTATPKVANLQNFTVEAWVKWNGVNYQTIYAEGLSNSLDPMFSLTMRTTGYEIVLRNSAQVGLVANTTNNPVPANQWTHVSFVRTSATSGTLFVNGVKANDLTFADPGTITVNVATLGVRQRSQLDGFLNGNLDEVRIWNRALCQGEIQNNMNCELGLPQSGLLAYYRFNQGFVGGSNEAITTLTDVSGNNNNGTLMGFHFATVSNWVAGNISGSCVAFTPVAATITTQGSTSFCQGDAVVLSANTGAGYTYQWKLNGNDITDATGSSYSATTSGSYTVVVNANNCPATSQAVNVVVNPLPTVAASTLSPVCEGDTIKLFSSAPGLTYAWSGPDNFASAAQHPMILDATTDMAGTYTLTATNGNGCSTTSSATVVVNTLPVITATSNSPVCDGKTLQLSAGGGVSYVWDGPNSFSSTDADPSFTASLAATGTYFVKGTGANGCRNAATVNVVVNPLPVVAASSNTPVNVGGTLTLTGTGATTYAWSGPNTFSATGSPVSINGVTLAAAGSYTVTGTDANGCVSTASTTVQVNPPGKALHFDGVDDWVGIPVMPAINSIPVTLEAMVKPDLRPEGDVFYPNNVLSNDLPGNHGLGFGANVYAGGSKIVIEYKNGFREIANPAGLAAGVWSHIAVVYNLGNFKVYVNGVLVDDFNHAQAPLNNTVHMHIGKHNDDGGYGTRRFFRGAIDEVRVWNRALCPDEITAQYNCQLNGTGTGLFANYNFDQGFANANNSTVTTLNDATTNNADGTLHNFGLAANTVTSNWIEPGGAMTNCSPYLVGDIHVKGNGQNIFNNTTAVTTSNNTDLGGAIVGNTITKSFSLENNGTAPITVSGITLAGAQAASFAIGGISFPVTIAAGNNAAFNVSFNATALGQHNATVSIASDDCDENPYKFNVRGTITCSVPAFTTCPSNQSVNTTSATCNTVVNYVTSVIGAPAPSVSYTLSGVTTGSGSGNGSGLTFNKGVTTVTINATNPCGTAQCSFTVTVNDVTPPAIACPADINVNANSGLCGAAVTFAATGSDNCGNPVITYSHAPGSIFPVGTTTVTATATDASNNSVNCSFKITVADNQAPIFTSVQFPAPALALSNVPEAADYSMVYQLNIPNGDVNWDAQNQIPYSVNNVSALSSVPFDRIAYMMELNNKWVWVSMNAFTTDLSRVGLHPGITGFQQTVANMNVFASSNAGVTTGTGISTGNIEMWSNCYGTGNGLPGIGGNGSRYDFNDATQGANCYGSFQVHNWGAQQTLLAYNSWSASEGGGDDVGIGNNPGTHPDWTFTYNNGTYTTKRLYVFVKPSSACPQNMVVSNTPGQCGAIVNYPMPNAKDNCVGTTVTRTAGPASGSLFPLGVTTVTHQATDPSGNTAFCTFTVAVSDNEAPAITCPASVVINCNASSAPAATGSATATDNCGVQGVAFNDASTQNADVNSPGHYNYTITRTWTATDIHNNSKNCIQTITVQDVTDPSISGPANATVNCQDATTTTALGSATGEDNCSPVAISHSDASTQSANALSSAHYNYVITRTWTVKDVTGNDISANQIITVQDVTKPTISCPAAITVACDGDTSIATTGMATATDNCSPVMITRSDVSTQSANVNDNAHYNYTVTRTWVAKDVTGNSNSCVQIITVEDVVAPAITNCPSSVTVNCQDGKTPETLGAMTAEDNCSPVAISHSDVSTQHADANNSSHYNYTITRTWTVTDVTGNDNSCTQVITVQDVTKPSIAVPQNATVNCQDDKTPGANGTATGTDNCSPVAISFSDASTQNANANSSGHYNYTITRTWTATDVTGNSTSADQVITVQDVTKPSISVPENATVNCHDDKTPGANGTASGEDNCSPVSITFSDVSTQNASNTNAGHYNYSITRTWTATDVTGNSTSGNQVITVQDVTKPGITVPQNATVNCQDDHTPAANGTAAGTDNCSPVTITYSDVSTQNASNTNSGHYNYTITRTWTATDVTGNSTSGNQVITVQDVTKPAIVVPQSVTVNCQDDKMPSANGEATGTDNCSPVTITYSDVSTQNASNTNAGHYNYTITRTWTATDVTGNSTSGNQVITVQDVTKPGITVPANATVNCQDDNTPASNGTATGTDNCSPVTITYSDASTQNASNTNAGHYNYTITRTWTATDVTGNSTSGNQVITVQDVTKPGITVPANATVNCQDDNTPAANGTATGTDNCSPVTITYSDASTQNASNTNAGHYNYTITRTWTATDVTGNSTSGNQVITVQDVTKPGITVPANATVNCQDDNTPAANGTATGTDNCSPVTITYSDASTQNASNSNAGHYNYTITRTWTAIDVTGNSTSGNQVITVQDVTKPGITIPQSVTVNCQDDKMPSANGEATGTDNCSPVNITYSDVSTQHTNINNAAHYNYVITRTWKATDVTGNFTTGDQTITVQDVTKPSITCPADATVSCKTGVQHNGTATGSDNCSPVAITHSDVSTQNSNPANAGHYNYTITRTWTATDVTGNSTTCNQVITVHALNNPAIAVTPVNTINSNHQNYTIYQGYGPQSVTLASTVQDGVGTRTYSWSPVTGVANPNSATTSVSPLTTTTYTVTITDATGCSITKSVTIQVIDVRCGNKIKICHYPPGNTGNPQQLCLPTSAIAAHLAHGCVLGDCPSNKNSDYNNEEEESHGVENMIAAEVKVYPNPNNGAFVVELPAGMEQSEVMIMDMAGKMIQKKTALEGNKLQFDLGPVARGMYMLHLTNGSQNFRTRISVQ